MIKNIQSRDLTYNLHKVVFVMDKMSDKILDEKLKMSFTQFKILMAVGDKTVCQREIAEYWNTTEAAVSRQIEMMVEDKHITRKENKENRRQNILTLTKKGQDLLEKGYKVLDDAHNKMFENLSANEKKILIEGLRKLLNVICTDKTKDPFISCK